MHRASPSVSLYANPICLSSIQLGYAVGIKLVLKLVAKGIDKRTNIVYNKSIKTRRQLR